MTSNQLVTTISCVFGAIFLLFVAFAIGDKVGWERYDFYLNQAECRYKTVQELPAWCLKYLD